MAWWNYVLCVLPLTPAVSVLIWLWQSQVNDESSLKHQLFVYMLVSVVGFSLTNQLVPRIQTYTLRKGLSGKDLGKRGTATQDVDVPEALGIVPGAVFLICLIFCLVGYASSNPAKLLDCNSALLSICFMLFLGFTDDVLDWPWRYKLFLPSIASLPLLCCYNGSTSILVPIPLRSCLVSADDHQLTLVGRLLHYIVTVDVNSDGAILNLGLLYLLYMGMLAVFCTNAINIYAGINGLEVGQSYIIASFVLLHNFMEIYTASASTPNHLFSAMLMLSFLGTTLGLLRHNWYPATVFVGDTYCYFAGMTFAVVGILGHFSKTLLLFFIPQIINFLWSTPQLFKRVPCPRHRLPRFEVKDGKGQMVPSTFQSKPGDYRWLKRVGRCLEAIRRILRPNTVMSSTAYLSSASVNDTNEEEVVNMTLVNLVLQLLGPMTEPTLCVTLLGLQVLCCGLGMLFRYRLAQILFEG